MFIYLVLQLKSHFRSRKREATSSISFNVENTENATTSLLYFQLQQLTRTAS